jgi:hypothetical protein
MAEQKKFIVKNGLIAADLTYPTTDGAANQALVTDGAGNLTFGDASAGVLTFTVKNRTGSTLTKGTVVYVSGLNGNTPEVSPAQANSSSTMPAFGLIASDILNDDDGTVDTFGSLRGLNVSSFGETGITFALGDTLYVSATEAGKLTNVAPTGESNLIQNIGKIERATPTSNITIKVGGAGRTNATPALNEGNIFIGDSSDRSSTATLDTSIVPENGNLYYTTGRHDSDFDVRLAIKTTDDLTEGSNQYYTTARANTAIDARVTKTFVDNLNVDADTLDGLNSTQFLRSDTDATISANLVVDSDLTISGVLKGPEQFYIDPAPIDSDGGTVIIRGNLTVQGTQTIINSTTMSVNDLNIILADSAADSAAADGAGITVAGASATMTYDAAANSWVFNKAPYYNTDRILTTADEGSGNGLDADTLDGNEYEDIISEATALAIALG